MQRISLFLCILLLPLWAHAQESKYWEVGLHVAPFYFGRIESNPLYKKDHQKLPKGFLFGLNVEKKVSPRWGIQMGVDYSAQNRRNIFRGNTNTYLDMDFDYVKIPLAATYNLPVSTNESWFLIFKQGIQVSFLTDYKSELYNVLGQRSKTVYTPGKMQTYTLDDKPFRNFSTDWLYKKVTFGLTGSVGLKKYISENWALSAALFYDFDLTDAGRKAFAESYQHLSPVHNFRIGIQLGIHYRFSFRRACTTVKGIL